MEQTTDSQGSMPVPFIPVSAATDSASTTDFEVIPTGTGLLLNRANTSGGGTLPEDTSSGVSTVSRPGSVDEHTTEEDEKMERLAVAAIRAPAVDGNAMLQPKLVDVSAVSENTTEVETTTDVSVVGKANEEVATLENIVTVQSQQDEPDKMEDRCHSDDIQKPIKAEQNDGTHQSTSIGDTIRESHKRYRRWLANLQSQIDWDRHTTRLSEYKSAIRDTCTSALSSAYVSPWDILGGAMVGAGVAVSLISAIGMVSAGALIDGGNWMLGNESVVLTTDPDQTQHACGKAVHLDGMLTLPLSTAMESEVQETAEGPVPGGLSRSHWDKVTEQPVAQMLRSGW